MSTFLGIVLHVFQGFQDAKNGFSWHKQNNQYFQESTIYPGILQKAFPMFYHLISLLPRRQ